MDAVNVTAVNELLHHFPADLVGAEIRELIRGHHEVNGVTDLEPDAAAHRRCSDRVQEPHRLPVHVSIRRFIEIAAYGQHRAVRIRVLPQLDGDRYGGSWHVSGPG